MRYADGPSVEVDVQIAATPKDVWALVTDLGVHPQFSEELQAAAWIDCEGPDVGASFVGHNAHAALGAWDTTSIVTRCDPPVAFTWSVSDVAEPTATWWYLLEPSEDGTHLRHGGRMGPAPSGLSIAIAAMPDKEERIIARRLQEWERNLTATVQGIKALAESGR